MPKAYLGPVEHGTDVIEAVPDMGADTARHAAVRPCPIVEIGRAIEQRGQVHQAARQRQRRHSRRIDCASHARPSKNGSASPVVFGFLGSFRAQDQRPGAFLG